MSSHVAQLGDRILAMQARLGLPNPSHFLPGMSEQELAKCPLLEDVSASSELHDLFAWRNGTQHEIAMGQLWLTPGFFLVSAQDSLEENRYSTEEIDGWSPYWFPLLADGAAGRRFFDKARILHDRVPVFNSDPESSPAVGQIYDSIKLMFQTILACYESGAYFKDKEGFLNTDFQHEVEIARCLNPHSDYWVRTDLL